MRVVTFTWEQVTEEKTIETTTNVIQVGFANYGSNSIALLNGYPLYPQGGVSLGQINNYIFFNSVFTPSAISQAFVTFLFAPVSNSICLSLPSL